MVVKWDSTENWLTETGERVDFLFTAFHSTALSMKGHDYSVQNCTKSKHALVS
jgi:hypothetical protein